MLATIRDKASGVVAGVIVGALVISFAFWGVSSYFGGGNVNVAVVNGTEISYQTFQRSFYSLRQQMQSLLGNDALTMEEEDYVKVKALEKLVNTELVNQLIDDNRLRVNDNEVVDTIKNLEYFKGEKGFDRLKYERAVSSMGIEPVLFERQLKMDLLSEQLQSGLSDTQFVLDDELEDVLKLKLQTRDITYTTLELSSFIDADREITDADIDAFYSSNSEKFIDPEKVKIAYLELDADSLSENVEINETDLRAYYNNQKDNYDVVEQRSVTKLFVQTATKNADGELESVTEEEKKAARKVIEEALTLVKAGQSFEVVLESFTEEGKAALQFSENNFLPKGVLEKEVETFLFASDEDAISDIIETEKGFNIIKVGEIRGGPKNVYETVAEQVENDYKQAQAELQFFELADQLTNLSYEHSDSLEVAAEAINATVTMSPLFSRDNAPTGLLSKPEIISASFDSELISSGINSDAIELADNHIVVLRVLEHQVEKNKPLEVVRNDVIAEIRLERAEEDLKRASDAIVEQLNSGQSIDELDSAVSTEWVTIENTKRDNIEVNRSVLRMAFQMGVQTGPPIVDSQRLGSGDYSIVIVKQVHTPEVIDKEDELAERSDIELRRVRGTNEWQEFLNNVREHADIELFKENT